MNGLALKVLSISAKFFLLFFILKNMDEGGLSLYYFYATCAIILARILSFGCEEQVAIYLKAKGEHFFYPFIFWFGVVSFFSLVGASFLQGIAWVALAISIAFSSIISGFVRSNKPSLYEVNVNVPYVVVVLLCALLEVDDAFYLILLLGFSFCVVAILVLILYRPGIVSSGRNYRSAAECFVFLFSKYAQWVPRVSSSSLMVMNLRYYIVIYLIVFEGGNDYLAFALSVGEVVWQLGMVFVNRRFSELIRSGRNVEWIRDVLDPVKFFSAYLLFTLAGGGVGLWLLLHLDVDLSSYAMNYYYVMGGVFAGCTICALSYLRVIFLVAKDYQLGFWGHNFYFLQVVIIAIGSGGALLVPKDLFWLVLYLGGGINILLVFWGGRFLRVSA